MNEQFIRLGSTVLDRARNQTLRVVGRDHRPAAEHPHVSGQTPMARQYGIEPDDTVYKCVFLPVGDEKVTSPNRTYDYAESKLTRYPVEAALDDGARRIHTQIIIEFLAEVFGAVGDEDVAQTVADAVNGADDFDCELPPEELIAEARELADANTLAANGGEQGARDGRGSANGGG